MQKHKNCSTTSACVKIIQDEKCSRKAISAWSDNKPHWKTSLLSGLVLASFTINYLILNFYFAATTGFAQTILWGTLFIQVILLFYNNITHLLELISCENYYGKIWRRDLQPHW
jgi:hypothetical protein